MSDVTSPPDVLAGAVRVERALIWVEGPDAAGFLHGLLSNDITALGEGDALSALLLDAKGHLVVEAGVHRDGPEAFTLLADPAGAATLMAALERYHFSEELELIGPEPVEALLLPTASAPHDLPRLPGPLPDSSWVLSDDPAAQIAASGLPEVSAAELENLRIRAGRAAVGRDTGPRTLVQEARLEDEAVSFTKGCYLGQETVARVQFRGRVNRVLRRLDLDSAPASLPAALELEGREVGRLTSVTSGPAAPVGLAIVRREVEAGARLSVAGGGQATVRDPADGPEMEPASTPA